MNKELEMNPNKLVAYLGKPAKEFTKADIVRYIKENGVRMVNFMYPAGDGRLKTLNFVINNEAYLDAILTCGERVDGSSLFSFIEAGSSDLYVLPRFCTAFIDPFAELPTLSMLCSYFNKDGEPLESSPEHTLKKACKEVNSRVKLNIPLNYPQLKRMRRKLSASEWEQLVDYIIHKYFPFDMESLLSYYESYDNMLLAVNSNTGGEYDLKEDFLPFSDLPYAEMIACICERVEPADVSKIVMMTPEEKKELFIELKRRTSADERQIRKFLHMNEGGQQLVDTDEDT